MRLYVPAFVALAFILGCGSQVGPVKLAAPRFEIANVKVDDSCTVPYWQVSDLQLDSDCGGLLDYCVRARANVRSLSDREQSGVVYAVYTTPEGKEVRKKQNLTVGALESSAVSFNFDEASVGDDKPEVEVAVDRKNCTRVTCDITNTGDAAGTASVEGLFQGASKGDSLNLAPGQTRTLTFDFPNLEATGQGECRTKPG